MSDAERYETCRWWVDIPYHGADSDDGAGNVHLFPDTTQERPEWAWHKRTNWCRRMETEADVPVEGPTKAIALDWSMWRGRALTTHDFGCVMHEPKDASHAQI